MPYVETVKVEHIDLQSFAVFIRKTKPQLIPFLAGPEGKRLVWDGLMALVEEIGYPHEIKVTDKIADTLTALMPYIEAYGETTDSS